MNKREEVKRYEKLNKQSECIVYQLSEEEKIKYGLKERETIKEMNIELQVDEQFKNLLPPLSKEEFSKLEELIVKEGCTESIKIWKDNDTDITYIIDGHNRNAICTKHNIQFKVEYKEFSSKYEVIDWIINFQFGRRNLSVEEKYYLSGLQYENEKKSVGAPKGSKNALKNNAVEVTILNSDYSEIEEDKFQSILTAERIGKQHGVTEKSIRDNGKYANTVNEIAELVGVEAKNNILTGEKKISKENIIEIGKQIKSGDIDKNWLKEQFIESNEKKVKLPEKKIQKVVESVSIEVKPIEQNNNNQTVKTYVQEKENTPTPSNNIKEIIKDIKTPKYFAVEFNFLDELECVQDNIKQSIEMANDFLFERYDIEYNITQEEKDVALDCLKDLINKFNDLRNKLKNTKTKENM